MATTPSWLSCLKPHVSWVFGQLRHFNFSGPGATHREARKVFAQAFFKRLVGFGVKPQDLPGVRGVLVPGGHRSGPTEAAAETSPCLPLLKKKGGRMSPSWGASAPALGAIACGACAPLAALFSPAAPVSGRAFLKKGARKTFTRSACLSSNSILFSRCSHES